MERVKKWLKKKIEYSEKEIEKLQELIYIKENINEAVVDLVKLDKDKIRLKELWAKEEAYMECLKEVIKECESDETSKDYNGFKL